MELLHLIILGLIQGLTEFLPISSSAHLILMPVLTTWQDQGLVHDIAAHVGSLTAVIIYFRKDLQKIFSAWIISITQGVSTHESLLFWYVAIATLPTAIAGYLLYDFVAVYFRSPLVIAVTTIVFGALLWWADIKGQRLRQLEQINLRDAIIIGTAQALAIIPGTSRSGITMTAGLMLGLNRQTAARFSFLLMIPVITLAGCYEAYRYFVEGAATDWLSFFIVAVVSGISAGLAIHYFLKFLERTGMLPYVIYRFLLGAFLFYLFV